jgi:hypothetical protein
MLRSPSMVKLSIRDPSEDRGEASSDLEAMIGSDAVAVAVAIPPDAAGTPRNITIALAATAARLRVQRIGAP